MCLTGQLAEGRKQCHPRQTASLRATRGNDKQAGHPQCIFSTSEDAVYAGCPSLSLQTSRSSCATSFLSWNSQRGRVGEASDALQQPALVRFTSMWLTCWQPSVVRHHFQGDGIEASSESGCSPDTVSLSQCVLTTFPAVCSLLALDPLPFLA